MTLAARSTPLLRGIALTLLMAGGGWAFSGKEKPDKVKIPDFSGMQSAKSVSEKSYRFNAGGTIRVDTGFMGSVKVVGWEKPFVKVRAETTVYGVDLADLEKNAKEIRPRITRTETEISVGTVHPAKFQMGRIEYTAYVPRQRTNLYIKANRGPVSVENVNGWVEADTVVGYLHLVDMNGYVSAKTYRGDILVQLKGQRWEGLQVGAATELGSVSVYMPFNYSCDMTLITLKGGISVDYPSFLVDEEEHSILVAQKKEGAFVNQKLRFGGANVLFQTKCGDVFLKGYDQQLETLDPGVRGSTGGDAAPVEGEPRPR